MLKKGTTALAQRARAASRILEAQVGTNPRIRVQSDDAFVLWDQIPFKDSSDAESDKGNTSPEWVRRTVCCAQWEADNAASSKPKAATDTPASVAGDKPQDAIQSRLRVVLAVCSSSPSLSPQTGHIKLHDAIESPVPLPAPVPILVNKHEPRSSGTLVAYWAARAGMEIFDVKPSPPANVNGRSSEEEERPRRSYANSSRGRRPPQATGAVDSSGKGGLVERPPAVMAMMEMVAQPSKVVRVLARGEKLDPDP